MTLAISPVETIAENAPYVKLATFLAFPEVSCNCSGCCSEGQGECVVVPRGPKAAVYRIFNAYGDLLYVGCSQNVENRAQQMVGRCQWESNTDVAAVLVERYATLDEARTAEARAIATEGPLLNIKVERPPLHDGWVVVPTSTEAWKVERAWVVATDVDPLRLVHVMAAARRHYGNRDRQNAMRNERRAS